MGVVCILFLVSVAPPAPIKEKETSTGLLKVAQDRMKKERARISNSVEGLLLAKAKKDGEVFSFLKPPQGAAQQKTKKLTRAQQMARKEATHEAIRQEILQGRIAVEPKPMTFDD